MKLPLVFSRKINVLSEQNPLQTLKRMSMALLLCFLIYAFTFAVYSWRDEKIESLSNMENMMELEARALNKNRENPLPLGRGRKAGSPTGCVLLS